MPWRSVSLSKQVLSLNRAQSNFASWLNCDRSSSCFTPQAFSKIVRRGYGDASRQHAPGLAGLRGILRVADEVSDAVAMNRPVVALESTIYTHGALGADLNLEAIVRKHGAVPAVCGILNGVPTVGLTPAEVDLMVTEGAKKASRRDLAYLVGLGLAGQKIHGGTTISGTMILARLAGIRVFGTGGLGGVHRGGQDSMDVSADLTELGRTRVAVISSGCKGFLDIPRTLEFLETHGVAVSTFADGRTGSVDFPAFWARDSGVRSPSVVQDEAQAAAIIFAQERLGIESGLLFANPIPHEYAISGQEMDAAINLAVREADEKGFSGNENTPYILKRIKELTQGRSVPANKHLVQANVARASKIAVELTKLLSSPANSRTTSFSQAGLRTATSEHVEQSSESTPQHDHPVDILVAGSVALDLSCDYTIPNSGASPKSMSPARHTSNPATITQSVGGVGYNVALAAHRIGGESKVKLYSMVGKDIAGATILSTIRATGLDTSGICQLGHEHKGARTAQYIAVNGADKNLELAMADMDIFTTHSSPAHWATTVAASKPRWLVVDGNWSAPDVRAWTSAGRTAGARIAFEPVSTAKSARLFPPGGVAGLGVFPRQDIDLATPNQLELAAMYAAARAGDYLDSAAWFEVVDALGIHAGSGARDRFVRIAGRVAADAGIPVQSVQLLPFIPTIVAKMGASGVLLTELMAPGDPRLLDRAEEPFIVARAPPGGCVGGVYMRAFPAAEAVHDAVSVNGVGDTFLGALVAGLAKGGRVERLVDVAQRAAVMTLRSRESVSADLGTLKGDLERAV